MENNEFLNQFIQILLPILATAITALFTYIGTALKKAYESKVNNDTAKAVAQDVVKFVEQVYTDLDGPEKLQKATEQAAEILKSKGINISSAEINMLIESAVYGLNEGWFDKKENQELMKDLKLLATNLREQQVIEQEQIDNTEAVEENKE